jgi:hypothetical protein
MAGAAYPAILAGEDEAFLVAGESVERRADDARHREHALDVETHAGGLQDEATGASVGDDTGHEVDSGPGELLAQRAGGVLAEP